MYKNIALILGCIGSIALADNTQADNTQRTSWIPQWPFSKAATAGFATGFIGTAVKDGVLYHQHEQSSGDLRAGMAQPYINLKSQSEREKFWSKFKSSEQDCFEQVLERVKQEQSNLVFKSVGYQQAVNAIVKRGAADILANDKRDIFTRTFDYGQLCATSLTAMLIVSKNIYKSSLAQGALANLGIFGISIRWDSNDGFQFFPYYNPLRNGSNSE